MMAEIIILRDTGTNFRSKFSFKLSRWYQEVILLQIILYSYTDERKVKIFLPHNEKLQRNM